MREQLRVVGIGSPDPLTDALHAAAEKLPKGTAVMLFSYDIESGAAGYVSNVERPAALAFIGGWVERQRTTGG